MLAIYNDDISEKIVYDFCKTNFLGESSYEKICLIINDKLKELKAEQNNNDLFIDNKNKHYINEDNKIEEIEEEEEE